VRSFFEAFIGTSATVQLDFNFDAQL
jgi:hypothetical protein